MEDRLSPRCWTAPPGLPGMTLQHVSSIHESWTSSQQSPHPSQDTHLSCCCWLLVSHSVMSDSLWPHVACHTPLSSALSQGLLKFISIESVILSNHLILCSSPSHFAVNLSQHQGLFQWVASSHQVAKGLELQLQQPSSQRIFSGLISFRIDWFDLLAVQGTLKSLLWHHNSKHQFFGTQQLPYGSVLTSGLVYWSNHSSDYTKICQQSDGSAF